MIYKILLIYIYIYCAFLVWSVLLTHYFADDNIEKNEMGWACNSNGGGERCVQGFGGETWGKGNTWKT
jgi:hypothetical protein